ncbi:cytokinin hydroxylase-like isoform X2 [Solanum dulcamara]|uniref:cytokinin hydroxylase-like isoform X2 n=1 Tax=Solanum dulcamara TaxID=45834 RepID=UPI002486578C|nr:cytokinin hydroxylase-like isoform X2 [Solanum dulcamara]
MQLKENIILFLTSNNVYYDNHSHFGHSSLWEKGRRLFVTPRICLTKANQIKEFLFMYSPNKGYILVQKIRKHFHGYPLLRVLGLDWTQRRRFLEPVWYPSKVQDLEYGCMVDCTEITVELLQLEVGNEPIEISKHVSILTSHIMARIEFGCSYEQGILIVKLLNQYKQIISAQSTWHSYIYRRRELKVIENQVERILLEIIQPRVDHVTIGRISSHGNDLLGKFLDEMHKKFGFINMKLIVDQCKKSLFVGDEPTTHLITSTLTLLSRNPYWQDLVRAEINERCHGHPPTAHQLRMHGLLNMAIKESLRLYPPVAIIERMVCEDIRLRDGLVIEKGVAVCIPVKTIHLSEEIWGEDVHEFNPLRFADDACAEPRKHFLPFSTGTQNCPAQYFALMKAKIILALFLSRFRFI